VRTKITARVAAQLAGLAGLAGGAGKTFYGNKTSNHFLSGSDFYKSISNWHICPMAEQAAMHFGGQCP